MLDHPLGQWWTSLAEFTTGIAGHMNGTKLLALSINERG